ncbi:MAG TPA: DUF1080 domain-containing protein [Planctomycetaceae bacterium]|nr:DUF1080 domain-containing protein [Planctomycetaceae bacterium]
MLTTSLWNLGLALVVLTADPDVLKQGVSDPAKADADFAIQGEYTGTIVWNGCYRPVGLQVVALGEGKFGGRVYPGGLPGNGFQGGSTSVLDGHRHGNGVVVHGDGLQFQLQSGLAVTATDSSGRHIGYLQPMHRYSLMTGARPPAGAVILFDGRDTSKLKNAKVTNGLLQIGAETVDSYRDFYLHAEFKTPYMPHAKGQARGNSGFYLQKRYEVQVLDSFGLESQFNDAAALYRFKAPDLNMSFPPLSWQTYDIDFTAARFDDAGKRTQKARITVRHNGVVVQNNLELENKTGGGSQEGPNALPILFQNHGNAVEFRNIWLLDRSQTPAPASCCTPVIRCR